MEKNFEEEKLVHITARDYESSKKAQCQFRKVSHCPPVTSH